MDYQRNLLDLHRHNPQRYPFLLQSVAHGPAQARYDILFACPQQALTLAAGDRDLDFLQTLDVQWATAQQPCAATDAPFRGGWFLYLGYELAAQIEPRLLNMPKPAGLPVAQAVRIPAAWVKDHQRQRIELVIEPAFEHLRTSLVQDFAQVVSQTNVPRVSCFNAVEDTPQKFLDGVARIREYIFAGDVFQVNLSRRGSCTLHRDFNEMNPLSLRETSAWMHEVEQRREQLPRDRVKGSSAGVSVLPPHPNPLPEGEGVRDARSLIASDAQSNVSDAALYESLCRSNPAPFAVLAKLGAQTLISSSPERLVRATGGVIEARPIAGTRPRGRDAQQDAELLRELRAHPKERAEHIMLVDLERNDLGRVCVPGSVVVDELLTVESYAHVHHLVSNVRGTLRPDTTPGDIIRAVFPGGTITGCPKVRCMEIIAELEGEARGAYTGSVGYLNHDGDLDLNILIRTLVRSGAQVEWRAGAGIVADSVAELELEETRAKARGLLRALGGAES